MQAVESDPGSTGSLSPLIERCLKEERLRLYAPAPLGEQRQRFLALARDLEHRKDSYLSQLSMLTLAGLNRRGQNESRHDILSGLLPKDLRQEVKEDQLWPARLVLKLGELYDREQEELSEAMRQIASQQEALLAELREEADMPFALTADLSDTAFTAETEGMLEHRLRAWCRLALHSREPLPGLLLTCHPAAMDTLAEVYERLCGCSPQLLGSLPLPLSAGTPLPAAPLPTPLSQRCPELAAALSTLSGDVVEKTDGHPLLHQGMAAWSQHINASAGTKEAAQAILELVAFPEVSLRELFSAGWGDGGSGTIDASAPGKGCWVGLLRVPPS